MDAKSFIKTFGATEAEAVCKRAGTNMAYFKQIVGRHRRPSVGLAQRLAEASEHRLDVMSLLLPPESKQDGSQDAIP